MILKGKVVVVGRNKTSDRYARIYAECVVTNCNQCFDVASEELMLDDDVVITIEKGKLAPAQSLKEGFKQ